MPPLPALPDEALEAFNRKYGHLNLRFMMVGAVREGSWHCYDIVREGIDKGWVWLTV